MYVVLSESPYIDVYDIDTSVHRRKIKVEGLVDGNDIVGQANWLHVSELTDKLIHRIHLPDENAAHWFVNSRDLTMSINKKGNIVVSCLELSKIIEYTPSGSCVREIRVDAIERKITCLKHAIQLDDEQFLICHACQTCINRVCIIDSRGRVVKSYGGAAGSGIGQLNLPIYLAVDQNGFILVVDHKNHRIIQLNASLEFIRVFNPEFWDLVGPNKIQLLDRRAYISASSEQNITILDL